MRRLPPTDARAALAGTAAAAVALGTAEFVTGLLPGGTSLFVAVAGAVIEHTPGPVVDVALDSLGAANRLVLLLAMLVGAGVAGALVGLGARRRPGLGPLGIGLFAAGGVAAGLGDPLLSPGIALAAAGVGAAAAVLTLRWLLARAGSAPGATDRPRPADAAAAGADLRPRAPTDGGVGTRRAFLGWAATAAGGAVLLAATGRLLRGRTAGEVARGAVELPTPARPLPPPPAGASLDVDGISPLLTPSDRFYRIDTAFTVPRLDPGTHRVRITGMVDRPFELDYDELLALADTEVDVTLACVSNEVGGRLVGNARWLGVPLDELLDRAGMPAGATQVVGRAVDGWTAGFPVEAALDGRPAVVAVGMNGEPLPAEHGFPVRLVVAGLYGYVSDTKWLSEIELTTFDAFDAYWIRRGWAEEGPIRTQSRIDVPRPNSRIGAGPVAVAGVAWAGVRGISAVEVAVDDDPWRRADLAEELAASSWRQWVFRWDAEPGDHVLRVRATDGGGVPQVATPSPPRPDGATGHHTIRVSVA